MGTRDVLQSARNGGRSPDDPPRTEASSAVTPESEGLGKRVPRPERFAVRTAMRHRRLGDKTWHEGAVVNISTSGVLFSTMAQLELKSQLELELQLPAVTGGESALLKCRGTVVRVEAALGPGEMAAVAAVVHRYRFVRCWKT